MNTESLGFIFLNSALVNNFVLALFLGICPFLGISGKRDTAFRMGMAVTFVLVVTATAAYGVHKLLVYFDALYLELIAYIAVIASSVQLVEMFIKRVSPTLFRALGIYLPPDRARIQLPPVSGLRGWIGARVHGCIGDHGWFTRRAKFGKRSKHCAGHGANPDSGGDSFPRVYGFRRIGKLSIGLSLDCRRHRHRTAPVRMGVGAGASKSRRGRRRNR